MTQASSIEAIRRVSNAVRASVGEQAASAEAVRNLGAFVREHKAEAAAAHFDTVRRSRLAPVDPMALEHDVFTLMNRAKREVSWTQWLAGLLRPENGRLVAELTWRALCDAILRRGFADRGDEPASQHVLASAEDWARAAKMPPATGEVLDEEPTFLRRPSGRLRKGIPDITIATPALYVILEIKLRGDFNLSERDVDQPTFYREIGLHHVARRPGQRLGLLALAAARLDAAGDYISLTWGELAQSMRRELRRYLSNTDGWIQVLPLLETVRSIEHHIEALLPAPERLDPQLSMSAFRKLQRLATHLSDTE